MQKIILALAHFGSSNRNHFVQCLNSYNAFEQYHIDAHLFLTEDIDCSEFTNLTITKHLYDPSIGRMLPHAHKPLFYEARGEYDYYLYCEDDVLISESHMEAFDSIQARLPVPYSCGFLRYEYKDGSDYKYLLDCHPAHSCHRGGTTVIKSNYVIEGNQYFETYNLHQGSYLLSKELFEIVADSGNYINSKRKYTGVLESAASDVYFNCGIIKVYPRNRVSELLVHHLPDKYVKMLPDVYTEEATPDDTKLMSLQKEMRPEKLVSKVVYDSRFVEMLKKIKRKLGKVTH